MTLFGRKRGAPIRPLLALLVLCGALPLHPLAPDYSLRQYTSTFWTPRHGLPQTSVNCLMQSRDGYLWLGTREGLVRFDGMRFQVYHTGNTPGLRSNYIVSLCEDRSGTLWIGTYGGGLTVRRGMEFIHLSSREKLPGDIIKAICQDNGGAMWIGTTDSGLIRLVKGKRRIFTTKSGLPVNEITALSPTRREGVWVGTSRGVAEVKRNMVIAYLNSNVFANDYITAIYEHADGSLWIGNEGKGIECLDAVTRHIYTMADGLPNNNIRVIHPDRDGNIWIGTQGGGLACRRQGKFLRFPAGLPLSAGNVAALSEDREGNLWIGTTGDGLGCLKNPRIRTFTGAEGLADNHVRAVFEDDDGTLLLGSTRGGLQRLDPSSGVVSPPEPAVAGLHIRAILRDRDGDLWLGTWGSGLVHLPRRGPPRIYTRRHGLASDFILALARSGDGALWIGTEANGLCRLAGETFTSFRRGDGVPGERIGALYVDESDTLWLGGDGGLARYSGGVFQPVQAASGFSARIVTVIHRDRSGALWVGSDGDGLFRCRDGRWLHFPVQYGVPSAVFHILDDARGDLWLGSAIGIRRLSAADITEYERNRHHPAVELFDSNDGLPSNDCANSGQPSCWRDRLGRLWFATANGLAMIDPTRLGRNPKVPPLHIEQVAADGRPQTFTPALRLAPGRHQLAIAFTAPSLTNPARVRFRYLMEGYDTAWHTPPPGRERTAYYANLPPGRYTFRLSAANDDGVWNPVPATFALVQEPYFHQTVPFYLLCLAVLAAAVFAFTSLRVRYLKHRQAALQRLVDERTGELRRAKEHTERINTELRQANEMKSEFLSIAVHDLRNPLQFILGNAELITLEEEERPEIAAKAGVIEQSSRRMLHLIEMLLAASVIDSGKLTVRKRPLDLHAVATAAIEYFRENAAHKEQRLELAGEPGLSVEADEGLLTQVVQNIVGNAVKFSPPGAVITLGLERRENGAALAIHDQGPGFTAKDQERLFQRFQRLSAKPTGGESSTGLGLFIARELMRLQGGDISLTTAPGEGSTFFIKLPAPPETGDDRPSGQAQHLGSADAPLLDLE